MHIDLKNIKDVTRYIEENNLHPIIWGAGFLGTQWGFRFLADKNIDVEFYCDSDRNLWNSEVNGRRVISIEELKRIGEDAFVFVIMGHINALDVCGKLQEMGINNVLTYTEMLEMKDVIYDYFPFMLDNKVAVYTCILGDYDDLKKHEFISADWDMYVITDKPNDYSDEYDVIDINNCIPSSITDPTRQNRYCKLHPHTIFPNYKYSIYYDANVTFIRDVSRVFDNLPTTRLSVASHLFVNCIYKEAMRLINARRDDPEIIVKQMKHYWMQGMPEKFGQYWNYVLAREHNNPTCVKLMEDWWYEVDNYSKRDQLSLPYVIWKNGFGYNDVGIIDGCDKYWNRTTIHKNGESRV